MTLRRLFALLAAVAWFGVAQAQMPSGPPAVGVVRATRQAVTETSEFIGRIQAMDRVSLTARVTAFLEQRLFTEGTEVKAGDLLYRLERPPFEAALAQQAAAVADASARLANANIQLDPRAVAAEHAGRPALHRWMTRPPLSARRRHRWHRHRRSCALRRSTWTIPRSTRRSAARSAAPTSPSATSCRRVPVRLATIVSQDPMYVVFPIAVRAEIDLEKRYANQGGMSAVVIRLRLPDGTMYGQTGKIDYVEPTVQATTDTILLRGKIANPPLKPIEAGKPVDRPLIDGEFVIGAGRRRPAGGSAWRCRAPRCCPTSRAITSTSSTPEPRRAAPHPARPVHADPPPVIMSGLKEGEMVVLDGIQRVRPGIQVNARPRRANADRTENDGSVAA